MSPGGWIHPYVMDSFGILSNTEQLERKRKGMIGQKDILRHIIIKDITVRNFSSHSSIWFLLIFSHHVYL